MTLQESRQLQVQNQGICENLFFDTEFMVLIQVTFENKKGREMAKHYGFKWNADKKMWQKRTNRVEWQVHTNANQIFINE